MDSILVTGGVGYIGSHLVKSLLESMDKDVVVIDNLSNSSHEAIVSFENNKRFYFYEFDLSNNEEKISKVLEQHSIKSVIHLSAYKYFTGSYLNYHNDNVKAVDSLSQAIKKYDKSLPVINISTMAVYGCSEGEELVIDSTRVSRCGNISAYGVTKLIGEYSLYATLENVTTLRLGTVVGGSLVDTSKHEYLSLWQAIKRGNVVLRSKGSKRNFLDVSAVVESILRVLKNRPLGNKVYNVTTLKPVTNEQLCCYYGVDFTYADTLEKTQSVVCNDFKFVRDLSGKYIGFRECHVEPDWLLVYAIDKGQLILTASRTGTHSDLF